MMSKQKYKLHPISAVINFIKGLKELIIPIVIILISNFVNTPDSNTINFWRDVFPLLIVGVPVFTYLVLGVIKWWTFVYWFENNEIRVEFGLFVKKKRYIPFERIQSLNYKEGVFHQLFNLVQVMVETAGNKNGKPEVELTAVTKEAVKQIELELQKFKNQQKEKVLDELYEGGSEPNKETIKVIHKLSTKDLVLLATTSNSMGVFLAGMAAILSQFAEYIPYDWIFEEISAYIQFGAFVILFGIVIALLLAWCASIVITLLNYHDFAVSEEEDRITITRGLLEKKRVTIPYNRIQAIKVIENPIRQMFGFASVVVESAGGAQGERDKKMVLFPLIRKERLNSVLGTMFPQFEWEFQLTRPPSKSQHFFYRVYLIWLVPVVGICSYVYYPIGMLPILFIIPIILLGKWQYKTTGYEVKNHQLTMVYRIFSKVTFVVEKKRIQVVVQKQSLFQRKRRVATVNATVMSGMTGATAKVNHINVEDADTLLSWFKHS
nr:PH domain-containing protein [Lysinibacillus timonensis]